MKDKVTPMLFPMEPSVFWKELRIIVREEIKGVADGGALAYETPGLTYKPRY